MAWRAEAAVPFAITGRLYFSPIIGEEIYVIDRGFNFYRYNFNSDLWTPLAPPNFGSAAAGYWLYRSLAISPDGTRLACCSDCYMPGGLWPTSGGRRIEIYDIATDVWTASDIMPVIDVGQRGLSRAVVWQNNDLIWIWAVRSNYTATDVFGKCIEYVPSTDTFTVHAQVANYGVGAGSAWFGNGGAAIRADNSFVSAGGTGGAYYYFDYNVGADVYSRRGGIIGPFWETFAHADDRNRLWFTRNANGRQGYIDVETYAIHYDIFTENPERDAGFGVSFGVTGNLANIIAYAKNSFPRIMSADHFLPTVQTDPATEVT